MGKLYDRRDLEHDLEVIDALEQQTSQQILVGRFPALKSKAALDLFDAERQHCKMQLLRSSQLVGDLRGALALFRGCPSCYTGKDGKQAPCGSHKAILRRAKSAVHWAAMDNLARRDAAGTTRPYEELHDGSLNEWEEWYYADRRMGIWPGNDPHYAVEQYGGVDYRGWLEMLLQEEEIPYEAYHSELIRLRGGL